MTTTRALLTLTAAALLAALFVILVPNAWALAGPAGVVTAVLALSALSAPFLSWGSGRAHANTLTNLIPVIYEALDNVSRELVGFVSAVSLDARADRIAKDQTLYSPVAPANTAGNITPAMTVTAASDQTIGTKSLTVDNYKVSGFNWTGEEAFSMDSGPGLVNIMRDQIAQCLRVHVNAIELAVATAGYKNASRAYGTAATTPFASNLDATANLKKILDDNGCPLSDRHLVMNTTAGANVRSLTQLTNVNEAGSSETLRRGVLLDVHGFQLRESAQVVTPTSGTASSATTDNAGYAVGATTITLASAGTGTILAGDVITFAGDTNKYVVVTGDSDVSNGGTIVLAEPGLKVAIATSTTAITMVATSARNLAFHRNAIRLATRLPKVVDGDLASDRQVVVDPVSGIAFEFATYPGYRMTKYEVAIAYGTAVIKDQHIAVLLG